MIPRNCARKSSCRICITRIERCVRSHHFSSFYNFLNNLCSSLPGIDCNISSNLSTQFKSFVPGIDSNSFQPKSFRKLKSKVSQSTSGTNYGNPLPRRKICTLNTRPDRRTSTSQRCSGDKTQIWRKYAGFSTSIISYSANEPSLRIPNAPSAF